MSDFQEKIDNFIASKIKETQDKKIFEKATATAFIFGQPMIDEAWSHYTSCNEFGELNNSYYKAEMFNSTDPDKIPIMDMETTLHINGYYFDALKFGHNFNILYQFPDDVNYVKIAFQGNDVFITEQGLVKKYISGQWEKILDNFFDFACKKRKIHLKNEQQEDKKQKENKINKILNYLKLTWG